MDQANIYEGLNQGQSNAVKGFLESLFDDSKNQIIISGAGGVGKTYTISVILDKVMPYYYKLCSEKGITPKYDSVHMTATTNKAAEVLGEASGKPTQTIHSFLNLKVKDNFSTGKSTLIKTKSWVVHERLILIIDEASMIDFDLYNMIQEGTKGCMIVYVGDHSQLAPVMEQLSFIYKCEFPFFNLTEPMRNSSKPDLMNICQQFRDTVETGVFKDIKIVPGVIDWLNGPQMEKEVINHFSTQTGTSKIVAYTNQQVINYNEYIRNLRNLPPSFKTGEVLVSNSAIKIAESYISVEQEITIVNQSNTTINYPIGRDSYLEVRESTISTSMGDILPVMIPEDIEHYYNLVRYFAKCKNWELYFFLKNTFPDLRQRDASTVYKSQGSTYNTIFIDLENIGTCRNANQVARMLYVAVSRPTTRIILYGQLPLKYGQVVK